MCTLTWLIGGPGYQIFFNRDELKTRRRALPPKLHQQGAVSYIAPTDADAGGSWISTNQFGITLCLLNNYQAPLSKQQNQWVSRGLLVKELTQKLSTQSIRSDLAQIDLRQYKPFDLIIFALHQPPLQIAWDGLALTEKSNPDMPQTSSSFSTTKVIRNRLALLANAPQLSSELLLDYHLGHLPGKGAYSVCMHRDDASTVSLSHVQVDDLGALFRYWDGSPCEALSRIPATIRLENINLSQTKIMRPEQC